MTTGMVHDQKHIEKQMGCMAGFLQIFDRNQILTGKRLYSNKRLPPSSAVDFTPESNNSMVSPDMSGELEKQQQARVAPSPERPNQSQLPELRSPAPEIATPADTPTKSPLPFPILELKEGTRSSWKFSREAPRLSLDSRAVVDAKGSLKPREIRTNAAFLSSNRCEEGAEDGDKHRKSPSVIARLMGLEALADSDNEPAKKAELRRSASESRVSRDLFQHRFVEGSNSFNFQLRQIQQPNLQSGISSNVIEEHVTNERYGFAHRRVDSREYGVQNVRSGAARPVPNRGMGQRKSFFDSEDFFPEPKQGVSIYGEIEKRLKMRGIDEPSQDFETLKHILEALQLKGLLRSKKPLNQMNHRNFVYDHRSLESPIVVMKPAARSSANRPGRNGNDSPPSSFRSKAGVRRHVNETLPALSPRRDRPEMDRNARYQTRERNASSSPTRIQSENGLRSPSRRGALTVETRRKLGTPNTMDSVENRRVSPVRSPKASARRVGSDQAMTNRSPRMKKPTAEIYPKEEKVFTPAEEESSSTTVTSESSISTCSHTDTERGKAEDYREGRSLLERCDKLLHSIAEITATELQPSPVSVLDSSFYKDESSPSPILKRRSIEFQDQPIELEDDVWSLPTSWLELNSEDKPGNGDFVYVSEIVRASSCLPEDTDIFQLLEKQQYLKRKDTSKVSRLRRRLIFDTINEILDRNRQLPPWKSNSWANCSISLRQVWSEFRRIREIGDASEDLFEVICGVLRKDFMVDGSSGWVDRPIEMSESVLDVERLIFKDLIGETIRDLAAFSGNCDNVEAPRRRLVF
ncbi:protein LONGIFOLIA 1 isoform X1 [Juglans microcarpa x Juglans regia]|uniref:protein LONGIFOLIA 1 isoform X1 n=2 Tax=Juglans microcarpa x Juglans regia TaxID=2249226 RepID=UPI001B7DDDC4|nr:protein LONGIFOLIA 1 isoform X1 [Juglans microcarpa x Juglans regia]